VADDPIAVLERWTDHGALYRVLELTDERAVVQLQSCYGEPVDLLESDDARLIAFLREREGPTYTSP
jgi:hypothetical protein